MRIRSMFVTAATVTLVGCSALLPTGRLSITVPRAHTLGLPEQVRSYDWIASDGGSGICAPGDVLATTVEPGMPPWILLEPCCPDAWEVGCGLGAAMPGFFLGLGDGVNWRAGRAARFASLLLPQTRTAFNWDRLTEELAEAPGPPIWDPAAAARRANGGTFSVYALRPAPAYAVPLKLNEKEWVRVGGGAGWVLCEGIHIFTRGSDVLIVRVGAMGWSASLFAGDGSVPASRWDGMW